FVDLGATLDAPSFECHHEAALSAPFSARRRGLTGLPSSSRRRAAFHCSAIVWRQTTRSIEERTMDDRQTDLANQRQQAEPTFLPPASEPGSQSPISRVP